MHTLFISTFNESVIIGLLNDSKLIFKEEVLASKNHSVNLIPTIERVLSLTNVDIKTIKEIIVVNGPGSFTGVRLGVTVAKTLAYTLKASIKTITSIEAISLTDNIEKKIVTIPDNKGIYYGVFENNKLVNNLDYLNNNDFAEFIKEYQEYNLVEKIDIDIELAYNYLKNKEAINPHNIKPVYIKKIEVLNGK